ncbi:hypothetical protein [Paenibacillus sp. Marseille-Q9583]
MNIRYEDKLKLKIEIASDHYGYEVLKMSLQRIVENAFILLTPQNSLDITIRTFVEEGMNYIVLIEYGRTDIKYGELDERYKSGGKVITNSKDETIMIRESMWNNLEIIKKRIKMEYGDEYGVELESIDGISLKISIRVPCLLKGKF